MNKYCAFSTSDDKYIAHAVTSLLSIRKWNKDVSLFVIGRNFSQGTKDFLNRYSITPVETDANRLFDSPSGQYPIECFYIFAGPKIFSELGYEYSLYIDGDIYCNADPFRDLEEIEMFAGVTNGKIKSILGEDYDKALQVWDIKDTQKERIQSGVVYFNNRNLKDTFLEEIGDLYRHAKDKDLPRKGDDSLFALYQLVNQNNHYIELPRTFNFIDEASPAENRTEWLVRNDELIDDVVFYHFTSSSPKPWITETTFPNYTCEYFAHKWRHVAIDNLNEKDLKKYYPQLSKELRTKHLRFYWYPSLNVGDLTTPYFLSKICKVDDADKYYMSEEEIDKVERKNAKKSISSMLFSRTNKKKALYCVSTGSVIRLCQDHALVFGSGIRSHDQEVKDSFVRSVRGPLTRGRFLDTDRPCPPIYGDPGLLLPRFYTPNTKKKYGLGIIPHFTEYDQVKNLYKEEEDVIVIDMGCGNLERVINMITSCERTVSSSLHGLVYSHAYGVPTRRIIYSDGVYGDGTKYKDYYLGIGFEPSSAIDASGFKKHDINFLMESANENITFDDSKLYDAMFFDEDGWKKSALYPY